MDQIRFKSMVLVEPMYYRLHAKGGNIKNEAVVESDPTEPRTLITESEARLGAQSIGTKCATCGLGIRDCPNHTGVIKVYPIPVPLLIDHLKNWVSIICSVCGRIGLNDDDRRKLRLSKEQITHREVLSMLQSKPADYICPFSPPNEPHKFETFHPLGMYIGHEFDYTEPALFFRGHPKAMSKRELATKSYIELPIVDNRYLLEILALAHKDDFKLIGLIASVLHPKIMLTEYICVSSPASKPRPSTSEKYSGSKSKQLYQQIAAFQVMLMHLLAGRTLHQAQRDMEKEPEKFRDIIYNIYSLYYAVALLHKPLPNRLSTIVHKELGLGPQKVQSEMDSLRKKKGFLRNYVAGNRHDVVARTPLAGYTYGAIGTVTFPKKMAMKMTIDVTVTPSNIELLRALVRNGPKVYPGANEYVRDGITYCLEDQNLDAIAASLIPGDIVRRHILSGDIGLHQRYPSIREESLQTVMMIVSDGRLIKQPLAMCEKQMADFDGDDTQVFFYSSFGVAAEAMILHSLVRQCISPGEGNPAIGTTEDSVSGHDMLINLSEKGGFTQEEINALFHEAFTNVQSPTGKKRYDIKDIFKAILPQNLYYDGEEKGEDKTLLIERGEIVKGMIRPKAFRLFNGYLFKCIATTIDPYTAIKVLEDITRLAYKANKMFGNSIADDVRYLPGYKEKFDKLIQDTVRRLDQSALEFHMGKMPCPVGKDPLTHFEEKQIFQIAEVNGVEIAKLVTEMLKGSSFDALGYISDFKTRLIPALGVKGFLLDVGKRFRPQLAHQMRHSVFFRKGDDSARAAGYIDNCYARGYRPIDNFYEGIPSRREAFDKGSSVQKQGYYNRKLGMSLGVIYVDYLGMMRGHSDVIIDYYYGQTSADPRKVINCYIDGHIISSEAFRNRYIIYDDKKKIVNLEEGKVLQDIRNTWRRDIEDYARITSNEKYNPLNKKFRSPVDLHALMCTHRNRKSKGAPATPSEIWEELKEMDKRFLHCHVGKRAGKFAIRIASERVRAFMRIFRFKCYTKRFIREKWTLEQVKEFCSNVVYKYSISLVAPGSTVGAKAALNISWPQTQMVLHTTRGGRTVMGNIDAIERTHGTDLFIVVSEGATKNANPYVSFMLKPPLCYNEAENIRVAKKYNTIKIKDVLISAHLYSCSPDVLFSAKELSEDAQRIRKWVESLSDTARKIYDRSKNSWFYIVLHINSKTLLLNNIDVLTIALNIEKQFSACIAATIPIYENEKGLYIILNLKPTLSIDDMHAAFSTMVESGIAHGRPPFRNGSVIKSSIIPAIDQDGSLVRVETYRIMFNGSDLEFLFSLPEIDERTITSTDIVESIEVFGIDEGRFRSYEMLLYETSQLKQMEKTLPQHYELLVDYITHLGVPIYITRSYVLRNPHFDILEKMTFEQASRFLIDWLPKSKLVPIRAPIACSLFGKPIPIGSNISKISLSAKELYPQRERSKGDKILDKLTKGLAQTIGAKKSSFENRVVPIPIDQVLGESDMELT